MKSTDTATPRYVAYILLALYACTEFSLFYFDVPIGNRETLSHVVSTLENVLLVMAGFIYGASIQSRNKDKSVLDPDGGAIQTKQTEITKVETETRQEAKPL
jgi:hypothetical protein